MHVKSYFMAGMAAALLSLPVASYAKQVDCTPPGAPASKSVTTVELNVANQAALTIAGGLPESKLCQITLNTAADLAGKALGGCTKIPSNKVAGYTIDYNYSKTATGVFWLTKIVRVKVVN